MANRTARAGSARTAQMVDTTSDASGRPLPKQMTALMVELRGFEPLTF